MRRALISRKNTIWQNAAGYLAAAVLLPVAVIVKLVMMPFERPFQRSASEVATYLRDFIDGTGGDWDWDDFTSIPIADPALEAIRRRAIEIDHLGTREAAIVLEKLHSEALRFAEAE